jgi:hypothetical protein
VEDDAIVAGIGVVVVFIPAAGGGVDFDVPPPVHLADADVGVLEVGARVGIGATRVKDADGLLVGRRQALRVEALVPPEVVDEGLGHLDVGRRLLEGNGDLPIPDAVDLVARRRRFCVGHGPQKTIAGWADPVDTQEAHSITCAGQWWDTC